MKRSPLARGTSKLSRTRIRRDGKRGAADPEALAAVRPVVLARACHRCERCGLPERVVGALHMHHRLRRSQGGTHEASNLVALCRGCHGEIHDGSHDSSAWLVTSGGGS